VLQCARLPDELLLSVRGDFGLPDVQAMKDILVGVRPGARITLDFSHAEQMQEVAIAGMAPMLEALKGSTVGVRGLCRHQLRLLAYMGAHLAGAADSHAVEDS